MYCIFHVTLAVTNSLSWTSQTLIALRLEKAGQSCSHWDLSATKDLTVIFEGVIEIFDVSHNNVQSWNVLDVFVKNYSSWETVSNYPLW